ncbi:MAG TPA: hypothetical protein DCG84_00545 [Peptococcaceae bacterium]|nr:hypothetical protein [Peptococcaceae bacterium]
MFSQDMGKMVRCDKGTGVLARDPEKQGSKGTFFLLPGGRGRGHGSTGTVWSDPLAIYTLGTVKIPLFLSCKFRLYVIFRRQSPKGFLWSFIHEARGRSF